VLSHPAGTAPRTTARPAVAPTTGAFPRWRTTSSTVGTAATVDRDYPGVVWPGRPSAEPTSRTRRTALRRNTSPTTEELV
jgi:hypothetical protein